MVNPTDKQFELSILHDELKNKLKRLESVQKNQQEYFVRELAEKKAANKEKILKSFHALNTNSEKLSRCYGNRQPGKQNAPFFYQQQIEDYFLEEESFTGALTTYTRKQFFEGISDLSGAKDQTKYDMLDISKPETLLIKGESEEIKSRDRDELQRLQSQYKNSEECRVKNEMSTASLKKAVETAEKQLQQLTCGKFDVSFERLQSNCEKLAQEIEDKKKELLDFYQTELTPLLSELQGLHGTKVLMGNYDLKLARQDYFLSKQSEVITQLLLQCSRNHFLSMMYEIELKKHRQSYHLLASSKSLLEKELKNIQHRILENIQALLSDPVLFTNSSTKETISSRDEFACRLHDSLVPSTSSDREELYKTFDKVLEESQILAQHIKEIKMKESSLKDEKLNQLQMLESTLEETQNIVKKKQDGTNAELSKLVENLEEHLAMAEVQVNEIIKDVMAKKNMLANDSLKELERTIFPNFFNNPERLKRTINELQSRIDTCTISSTA